MSLAQDNVTLNREHKVLSTRGETMTGDLILNGDPVVNNQVANKKYVDDEFNEALPIGSIVAYSGAIASIGSNWIICDGGGGSPNLVNRFVYGATTDSDIGITGGSNNATQVSHSHSCNSHNHTTYFTPTGRHRHYTKLYVDDWFQDGGSGIAMDDDTNPIGSSNGTRAWVSSSSGGHSHTITITNKNFSTSTTGSSGTDKNMPAYMKLIFIKKIS